MAVERVVFNVDLAAIEHKFNLMQYLNKLEQERSLEKFWEEFNGS